MEETIEGRLERIESLLASLVERQTVKDYYTTREFAKITGRAEFTAKEWCRLGRVRAQKRLTGQGRHPGWVVPHEELLRFQREGLLPDPARTRTA